MNLIGQNLGQYRVIEPVGKGGMAMVYKAFQPGLERYVAIKVLPAQHALTPSFKERFIREAKVVAQLNHPNILPIYDFGFEGDLSYFVMKLVPDRTLKNLMGRPMALPKVSRLIDRLASALDHAHRQGVLHRDIKPTNILLDEGADDDWVLLADFGLAKIVAGSEVITHTEALMGTPAYMSPEQANSQPVDHRSDIYSLGIVLYEMITGRVPYEGETPLGVVVKHISEPLPLPRTLKHDLPEEVEQVILKALAKDPAERYASAGDMAMALRKALANASVVTATETVALPSGPAAVETALAQASPARAAPSRAGAQGSQPHPAAPQPLEEGPRPAAAKRRWIWLAGGLLLGLLCFTGLGLGVLFVGGGLVPGLAAASLTPLPAATVTPAATLTPVPPPSPTPPPAVGSPAEDLSGLYQIQVVGSRRYWHANDTDDRLVSTRHQPDDDYTRFYLEKQPDGSYRIRVKASNWYLHADDWGDQLISTRYQENDDFTRFYFERQPDGTYKIRVKASNLYVHEDGLGDRLVSTRAQDDDEFIRFRLMPQTAP